MEHKDGALLRRKSPKATVQLVTVVDRQELVGVGRCVRLEQDDVSREMAATSRFGVAGIHEDPMEPCLKTIEITQRGELPPHLDESHLDRVLGEVRVAKDPMRYEDAAVADLTNKSAECLLVALSRLVHDRSEHPLPPGLRRRMAPSTSMSVDVARFVRYPFVDARCAQPGEPMDFRTEVTNQDISVVQHDLASLMDLHGLSQVDLAMVDIQGAETVLLDRARPLLMAGNVRFLIISTHHQSISGDPLTHQRALDLLRECGAHIIAEHTVRESYSGDGLIAATFDASQHDLTVPISYARAKESLFGEPEYEIAHRDRLLAASRAEVARIHRSKSWRWSSGPRAQYARLRRLGRPR